MELLDLVNEKDEVIGVTTKEKSHLKREIHRVVAIYVFDQNGKLHLQEHIKSGGKYDHFVGGHVIQGESYDHAAQREVYEELNISNPLLKIAVFYPQELMFDRKSMHTFGIYEVHPSSTPSS